MVSVLGCGWLGLPLAKELVVRGFKVKGSVRNDEKFSELIRQGIKPYLLLVMPELSGSELDDFFTTDVLIINFPPERREDISSYLEAQTRNLVKEIIQHKIPHVLFVSSTSVYPDVNRAVSEDEELMPAKGSGVALRIAERIFMEHTEFKTTVLRFGGLVGYDRLPGRFLAAKKNQANGDAPVNIIHQDDCIEIIYQIIQQNCWGEIFNAAADAHPLRKEYYCKAAIVAGLEPPEFSNDTELKFKLVNSSKLKQKLSYAFKYPDPLEMLVIGG